MEPGGLTARANARTRRAPRGDRPPSGPFLVCVDSSMLTAVDLTFTAPNRTGFVAALDRKMRAAGIHRYGYESAAGTMTARAWMIA